MWQFLSKIPITILTDSKDIINLFSHLNELVSEDISNYLDLFDNSPFVLIITINDVETVNNRMINKCSINKAKKELLTMIVSIFSFY